MKPFVHRSVLALTTVLALSGCGGGGGGGGSSANTYTSPVGINDSNAVAIAAAVVSGGGTAQSIASNNPLTGVSASTSQTAHSPSYRFIINQTLNTVRHALAGTHNATSSSTPVGVSGTVLLYSGNCDTGSYTVTLDDTNGNGIADNGETISETDSQCSVSTTDSTGVTTTILTDGTTTFNLTALTGDPLNYPLQDWSMGFTFSMNSAISMTTSDGFSMSLSSQGGATISTSYVASTLVTTTAMTGSSLKESGSYNGYNFSTELANFNFAISLDNSTSRYSVDIDYTLNSSEIGGSVTVVTNPVFTGAIDSYGNIMPPDTGAVTITGANNTQIVLEATRSDTAIMTVNGNSQTESWTGLGWGQGI